MPFQPVDEQLAILLRGTVDVEVVGELRHKLEKSRAEDRPLVVKLGCDPTAPDLHLGHTVVLTKLRQFQDLGHRVVFLIGDFTARIGDPTGKSATRPPLSEDAILQNAATYRRQVFKLLDESKTEIRFNSEWLGKMGFDDVIRLAAKYSVARMLERDDFEARLREGRPISMHELLYPLAQGYDSVALKADVELGGTDQRFNLLVGRDLMRHYGLEPQCIITTPILEGTNAVEVEGRIQGDKMSKSLGNYVGVEEEPQQQFGKVMSVCDALMWRYYELLSTIDASEVEARKRGHPKDAKVALAKEIVARFHGSAAADEAHRAFEELFGRGKRNEIPDDAPTVTIDTQGAPAPLVRILVEAALVSSNTDARRQIAQNAVSVDGERVADPKADLPVGAHAVRVGKTRWARVILQ
ncbi:MAG: tyrosine--tRNA ligase [Deltaproteobacteria bacterium]|nr:tyrosine--tRNA ligase [Deltaproteobacteria bacterium]